MAHLPKWLVPRTLRGMHAVRRWRNIVIVSVIILTACLWYSSPISHSDFLCYERGKGPRRCTLPKKTTFNDFSFHERQHIVIASSFGYHHDVFMALAWTLKRVMQGTNGRIDVYAPTPFGFDFQGVVDDLGLHDGTVRDPDYLIHDLTTDTGNSTVDVVILGTCEVDLRGNDGRRWPEELLSAWDARDDEHKFQLVCLVHNAEDTQWQLHITEWSRRSAFRILAISQHVANSFRESFDILSDSVNPYIRSAGYEHIPIDVYVPVLNISNLAKLPSSRVLSNAVIQGSFFVDRRDYTQIFVDLNSSLYDDPRMWGYLPIGNQPSYVVDESLPDPPFHLHLIGSGYLEIPVELRNVVTVNGELNYSEFYSTMSKMDICLPAFADNSYFQVQASSTMAMALECNVPILVTDRIKRAYTYLDDRPVVVRPAAMREVAALKALRSGSASDFLNMDTLQNGMTMASNPHIRNAVERMMHKGWIRTEHEWRSFKESIWRDNEHVVGRLLQDT